MKYGKVEAIKLTGQEYFHVDGKKLNFDILSFWQWSSSQILSNALRGIIAEYIVAQAINCIPDTREEWDAYDLLTQEGWKVEVKSASYIQSWEQTKPSSISFSIKPTLFLEKDNQKTILPKRQSDLYVFCLLAHKEQETIDPLNLSHWEFYLLPTKILNERVSTQKTIRLSSLLKLEPIKCEFEEMKIKIQELIHT